MLRVSRLFYMNVMLYKIHYYNETATKKKKTYIACSKVLGKQVIWRSLVEGDNCEDTYFWTVVNRPGSLSSRKS